MYCEIKKIYTVMILFLIILAVAVLIYKFVFESNVADQKTYDRAKAQYFIGELTEFLSDSNDVLLDNIYTAEGKRFNFESGNSKWYELVEFLSQKVYTADKKEYGPYFTVGTNADAVIDYLTPKANVGYSIVILLDDYSYESPVSFVYPCETESENVIRIIYSEDEFMRITEEH